MSRECSTPVPFVVAARLALGLACVCACSSDADTAPDSTDCIARDDAGILVNPVARSYDLICPLAAFPFTSGAGAVSIRDATVSVSQPAEGDLCLAGASSTNEPSFGGLVLEFAARNADKTQILSALDLDALGIAALAFTLDSPPGTGLLIEATSIKSGSCPGDPGACSTPVPGFALMTGPGSATRLSITSSGRVVAPFAHFESSNATSGSFDTSALDHIAFRTAGTYDFCLSDLAFLDASGKAVHP